MGLHFHDPLGDQLLFIGIGFDFYSKAEQKALQPFANEAEGVADPQGVGVVLDIHGRGPQVNDSAGAGALFRKGLDLRHEVMADLRLYGVGALDIHLPDLGFQFGQLPGAHQNIARLNPGETEPKSSPELPFMCFAPKMPHAFASVAPGKGREVDGIVFHPSTIAEGRKTENMEEFPKGSKGLKRNRLRGASVCCGGGRGVADRKTDKEEA